MIRKIAQLKPGDMITIDEEESKQFTGKEDFVIDEIKELNIDGVEVVIAELGEYSLIVSLLSGNLVCAICEDLNQDINYLDEKDFTEEIDLCTGEEDITYYISEAAYSTENNVPSLCEYRSDDRFINYLMLIEETHDLIGYRGTTVDPDNIIL